MELKLIDQAGQSSAKLSATDEVFGREFNESLIHQVVTAYMKWDPVSHWQIEQLRVWRTSVETALRKAPYAEPAEGSR